MSQPRMRKVVASGDGGPRARASVAKASGDSVACTVRPNQEPLRSRSKNKIPKSVRYDLENALVSLCDVWFEEIKPHLVRNNIKVHVHGSSAGGDHERAPPPAPPAPPPAAPAALAVTDAPGCSHLDPASAAPGCELCRLLFNAANCIESAVCQAAHAQPPATPIAAATQSHECEEKQLKRPRTRRKKCRSQPQPQSSWRVPRLCRTYSVLSPAATGTHMRRIASHLPPKPQLTQSTPQEYYRFIGARRKPVMKNSSTQTETVVPKPGVSVGCQWTELELGQCSSLQLRRKGSRSPAPSSPNRGACSLSPPRQCIYRLKRPEATVAEEFPLYQDDLIDIIGEENDKRLRLLYSSPEKDDYPSFMNLVPLPPGRQKKPGGLKKSPPWR